jgi:hypothetical protein
MNVEAKLMHMDVCIDKEDVVELMVVGVEKRGHGDRVREIGMTLTVQVPREFVKDYKLGEKFDIYLGRSDREYQLDPTLNPELQNTDPYLLGGEKMHNVLIMQSMQGEGDRKKVQRQAFKESFFLALKIRLQDPEFRETMLRDIEAVERRSSK